MKLVLILSVLVASAFAGYSFRTCGGDSSIVEFNRVRITPDPVIIPGTVGYDVDVNLKRTLYNVRLELTLTRHVTLFGNFAISVAIPCTDNVGSCTYDNLCSALEDMYEENWGNVGTALAQPIIDAHPNRPDLCQTGFGPIRIQEDDNFRSSVNALSSLYIMGRYSVRAVLKDNTNNNVIACVQIKAELKKAGGGGGFLFG